MAEPSSDILSVPQGSCPQCFAESGLAGHRLTGIRQGDPRDSAAGGLTRATVALRASELSRPSSEGVVVRQTSAAAQKHSRGLCPLTFSWGLRSPWWGPHSRVPFHLLGPPHPALRCPGVHILSPAPLHLLHFGSLALFVPQLGRPPEIPIPPSAPHRLRNGGARGQQAGSMLPGHSGKRCENTTRSEQSPKHHVRRQNVFHFILFFHSAGARAQAPVILSECCTLSYSLSPSVNVKAMK